MLEVDGVTWSLCHGRKPFIELALATILLDSLRHRDRSGQSSASFAFHILIMLYLGEQLIT